ncbi:hypothetical protein CIP107577_01961 [Corynebacterium diphtheriae]|nr:hypothetical protein CIP107577_01961 [Corynebacterium diphtheriae]
MSRKILTQHVIVPAHGPYPAKVKQFQVMRSEKDPSEIFISTPTGFILNQAQAESLARLLTQLFQQ